MLATDLAWRRMTRGIESDAAKLEALRLVRQAIRECYREWED